ncbi:MAG: alpha/beta hydrolase [Hyphomicrobiales bacterium]|nr:alpha/beta hydrolase [Hyphomicrobiales bacterium]
MVRSARRLYRGAPVWVVISVSILIAGCSPVRLHEALLILEDIQAGAGASELKRQTPEPERRSIVFELDGRASRADLYLPRGSPAASMIVVPGLTPKGRDDPRIIEFAATMARARFRVLVPDLPRMRALHATADDAVPIADAVAYLKQHHSAQPLGLTSVSFAVGPSILALFEPQAKDRVDFVVTVGGYYDIDALITFITTGYTRGGPDESWQYVGAKRYGKWVFVLSNAARIGDEADQAVLTELAWKKLQDNKASVDDLVSRLGEKGRSVYRFLTNDDPDRVPELFAQLPLGIIEDARRLDLKRLPLAQTTAEFVLIHDRHDRIIPAEHTTMTAGALPSSRAHVYLIDSLDHANPRPPGFVDGLMMLDAVYTVLALRDGKG